MSGGETGRAVVVVVFVVVVAVFVVVVAEVCASAEAKGRGTTAAGPCRARLASPTRASPPSSSSAAGSSVDCAAASVVVAVVAVAVVALAGPAAALGPTDELPLRPWSRLLAPSATDDRGAASQRGCAPDRLDARQGQQRGEDREPGARRRAARHHPAPQLRSHDVSLFLARLR